MPGKHDWNTWDSYLSIHGRRLRGFEHFILSDELSPTLTANVVSWDGILYCVEGVEIHVSKSQEVERYPGGRPMVRTVWYSYHVLRRRGPEVLHLLRYDNIHVQPGHPDHHHKHRFADDGTEIEPSLHVGEQGWPTLGDVLQEVDDWLTERRRVNPAGLN